MKPILNEFKNDNLDSAKTIQYALIDNIISKRNEMLEIGIKQNLNTLGYNFNDNEEFIDLVSKRLTLICPSSKPLCGEVYLDYINKEDKGTLLVYYNDEITCEVTAGGFNMKIEYPYNDFL